MTSAELNTRYRERQVALADSVGRLLGATLASFTDLGQEEIQRYVARAYPTVAGGQKAAAELAAGYMLARVRARPGATPMVGTALSKSGVAVTPESPTLVSPMLRARALVADGTVLTVALVAASSYAASLSSLDLQAAQRVGLEEGARAAGAKIEGWTKEPSGDACEWCQMVAGETYSSPDSVPFHANDHCAVVPAT